MRLEKILIIIMKDKVYNWLVEHKKELMHKFVYKLIDNKDNAEDFYQDLFIMLSEKSDKILSIAIEERDMFKYVTGIIYNNLKSKNSPYYYKYIKYGGVTYNEEFDFRVYDNNSEKYELLNEINNDLELLDYKIKEYLKDREVINPNRWYDNKVMAMYYDDDMTFRGISKLTDIPVASLFYTITQSRIEIVTRFSEEISSIKAKYKIYNEW